LFKELSDLAWLAAAESLSLKHFTFLVYLAHDAYGDSLFVEIDADKLHDMILSWEQGETTTTVYIYHALSGAV